MTPTSIYLAIMLECERRRLALNLPMEKFSEWAGIPDRYYSKALYSFMPSGRQAQWPTLDRIINALFPNGYDVIIKARPGEVIRPNDLKAKLLRLQATANPVSQRELMQQLSVLGNAARSESLDASRRKHIAKKAARARWKRQRALEKEIKKRGREIEAALIPPTQIQSS